MAIFGLVIFFIALNAVVHFVLKHPMLYYVVRFLAWIFFIIDRYTHISTVLNYKIGRFTVLHYIPSAIAVILVGLHAFNFGFLPQAQPEKNLSRFVASASAASGELFTKSALLRLISESKRTNIAGLLADINTSGLPMVGTPEFVEFIQRLDLPRPVITLDQQTNTLLVKGAESEFLSSASGYTYLDLERAKKRIQNDRTVREIWQPELTYRLACDRKGNRCRMVLPSDIYQGQLMETSTTFAGTTYQNPVLAVYFYQSEVQPPQVSVSISNPPELLFRREVGTKLGMTFFSPRIQPFDIRLEFPGVGDGGQSLAHTPFVVDLAAFPDTPRPVLRVGKLAPKPEGFKNARCKSNWEWLRKNKTNTDPMAESLQKCTIPTATIKAHLIVRCFGDGKMYSKSLKKTVGGKRDLRICVVGPRSLAPKVLAGLFLSAQEPQQRVFDRPSDQVFFALFANAIGKSRQDLSENSLVRDKIVPQIVADYISVLGLPDGSPSLEAYLSTRPKTDRSKQARTKIGARFALFRLRREALNRQPQLFSYVEFSDTLSVFLFEDLFRQLETLRLVKN